MTALTVDALSLYVDVLGVLLRLMSQFHFWYEWSAIHVIISYGQERDGIT